jgi:AbrB family looped-hinge helix DNA binding protein
MEKKMEGKKRLIKVVKTYDASKKGGLVVCIPSEVKERLNIKAGDRFLVYLTDIGIVYEPLKADHLGNF